VAELTVEIVEGPGAGRKMMLAQPIELGRDPGVGMVLEDELASRRHARLSPDADGAIVEDLGSLNGTFVNGNQVHSPTRITAGDQVLVGVTVIQLRSAAEVARSPTAVRAVPPALATPPKRPDYIPAELAKGGPEIPGLDPLLDVVTKGKAKTAPLAIFVLVVIAVLIYLATR
jgi:pSer/pThr/pTyr-binding forkhead associated (FHA) protein